MRLQTYLEQQKIKPSHLAKTLGVSPAFVSRLLDGTRKPGGALALKIEEVTGGNVTLRDFHDVGRA